MAFSKPNTTPTQAGRVSLTISTDVVSGSVSPLRGSIGFTLLNSLGQVVAEDSVDVAELTENQRTSLTSLLTTIRNRVNAEAI